MVCGGMDDAGGDMVLAIGSTSSTVRPVWDSNAAAVAFSIGAVAVKIDFLHDFYPFSKSNFFFQIFKNFFWIFRTKNKLHNWDSCSGLARARQRLKRWRRPSGLADEFGYEQGHANRQFNELQSPAEPGTQKSPEHLSFLYNEISNVESENFCHGEFTFEELNILLDFESNFEIFQLESKYKSSVIRQLFYTFSFVTFVIHLQLIIAVGLQKNDYFFLTKYSDSFIEFVIKSNFC